VHVITMYPLHTGTRGATTSTAVKRTEPDRTGRCTSLPCAHFTLVHVVLPPAPRWRGQSQTGPDGARHYHVPTSHWYTRYYHQHRGKEDRARQDRTVHLITMCPLHTGTRSATTSTAVKRTEPDRTGRCTSLPCTHFTLVHAVLPPAPRWRGQSHTGPDGARHYHVPTSHWCTWCYHQHRGEEDRARRDCTVHVITM